MKPIPSRAREPSFHRKIVGAGFRTGRTDFRSFSYRLRLQWQKAYWILLVNIYKNSVPGLLKFPNTGVCKFNSSFNCVTLPVHVHNVTFLQSVSFILCLLMSSVYNYMFHHYYHSFMVTVAEISMDQLIIRQSYMEVQTILDNCLPELNVFSSKNYTVQ